MNLREPMRAKYAPPEWALFFEVANGVGFSKRRYADAVAMSLFPSRGLEIHGFEFKVSRGDWLKELKQPEKADESVWMYCDRWWVVAPKDIIKDGELPKGWGHIAPSEDAKTLRIIKQAVEKKAQPVTRPFLAAIFRRANESSVDENERSKIRSVAWQEGIDYEKNRNGSQRQDNQLADLRKRIQHFQDSTGLDIEYDYYSKELFEQITEFVKAKTISVDGAIRQLERQRDTLNCAIEAAKKINGAEILKESTPQPNPSNVQHLEGNKDACDDVS